MWTDASTTALWTSFAGSVSGLLYTVLGAIVTFLAAMLVLGWAVRKTKKHVTGKKF